MKTLASFIWHFRMQRKCDALSATDAHTGFLMRLNRNYLKRVTLCVGVVPQRDALCLQNKCIIGHVTHVLSVIVQIQLIASLRRKSNTKTNVRHCALAMQLCRAVKPTAEILGVQRFIAIHSALMLLRYKKAYITPFPAMHVCIVEKPTSKKVQSIAE